MPVRIQMSKTGAVTQIDTKMERVEIKTADGNTHSIPLSVFRHVASGKLTVNRIAEFIPIYREITKDWLRFNGYS
jgi:hypothetical protein